MKPISNPKPSPLIIFTQTHAIGFRPPVRSTSSHAVTAHPPSTTLQRLRTLGIPYVLFDRHPSYHHPKFSCRRSLLLVSPASPQPLDGSHPWSPPCACRPTMISQAPFLRCLSRRRPRPWLRCPRSPAPTSDISSSTRHPSTAASHNRSPSLVRKCPPGSPPSALPSSPPVHHRRMPCPPSSPSSRSAVIASVATFHGRAALGLISMPVPLCHRVLVRANRDAAVPSFQAMPCRCHSAVPPPSPIPCRVAATRAVPSFL